MTDLLQVRGLGHRYGPRTVLDDVDLTVRAGEFVALLGPSGAGKTTLIRCVAGLMRPSVGEVVLAGEAVTDLHGSARRRIAVVFQQFNLVRRLSALDNVLAGRLGHVSALRGCLRRFEQADRLLAMECLERVGLLQHAGTRADRLSGGEQQRVAIARALAQQPELIVADEPVASLDPGLSAGILELLQQICTEDRLAVLCSLHQPAYAHRYAQRLVGLAGGHVHFDGQAAGIDMATTAALYGDAMAPGKGVQGNKLQS